MVKNPPANVEDARDAGSIPGLGRSPGEGNGNSLQYFCWKILWTEEPGGLYSPWSCKELDMTEQMHAHVHEHTHTDTHTHRHTQTHTKTYTYRHRHTHTHKHTQRHTKTHTYTHTLKRHTHTHTETHT